MFWMPILSGTERRIATMVSALVIALGLSPAAGLGQTNTTWNGGAGNWNDATKWSGGVVPNGSFNVFIDGGNAAASPVTLNINATVNNLTLDGDDSLTFNNSTSLTVGGNASTATGSALTLNPNSTLIVANGTLTGTTITMTSSGFSTGIGLNSGTLTLAGGTTLTMGSATTGFFDRIFNQSGSLSSQLTVGTGSKIQGAGNITNVGVMANGTLTGTTINMISNGFATGIGLNSGTLTLAGGTKLTMGSTTTTFVDRIFNQSGSLSSRLTVGKGSTLQGAGNITNVAVTNQGTILANVSGQTLTIAPNSSGLTKHDAINKRAWPLSRATVYAAPPCKHAQILMTLSLTPGHSRSMRRAW